MMMILKKMGWQSLSMVVSTTYDGKQFADAVTYFALKEKWTIVKIFWIEGDENLDEISTGIRDVLQSKPDVIIGHIRQRFNDDIFRTIGKLQVVQNSSAWLIDDVTSYGDTGYKFNSIWSNNGWCQGTRNRT